MALKNEHIQQLAAARAAAITQRRQVAAALAESYKRGHTENMRDLFVKLQDSIEAIDRAIADESRLAAENNQEATPGIVIKVTPRNE
jgi:hypothetical protein